MQNVNVLFYVYKAKSIEKDILIFIVSMKIKISLLLFLLVVLANCHGIYVPESSTRSLEAAILDPNTIWNFLDDYGHLGEIQLTRAG